MCLLDFIVPFAGSLGGFIGVWESIWLGGSEDRFWCC